MKYSVIKFTEMTVTLVFNLHFYTPLLIPQISSSASNTTRERVLISDIRSICLLAHSGCLETSELLHRESEIPNWKAKSGQYPLSSEG